MEVENHYESLETIKREFVPEIKKNEYLNKIANNLYLGNIDGATEYKYFVKEGITHVLSMVGEKSPKYESRYNITRKVLNIEDSPAQNIIQYFKECINYIENANKTYVYCLAGISRSATIVIAYLMWKTHSNYSEVLKYVNTKRTYANPNDGFQEQLIIFENLLKKNNYDLDKINFPKVKWNKKIKRIFGF